MQLYMTLKTLEVFLLFILGIYDRSYVCSALSRNKTVVLIQLNKMRADGTGHTATKRQGPNDLF